MKKEFLLGLFLVFVCSMHAQIVVFDVEAISTDSTLDNGKTKGYAALDFNSRKQNEVLYYFNTRIVLARKTDDELLIFNGRSNFTVDGNQSIINTGFANLRYLFNVNKTRWSPELFSQYQWDAIRGMEDRFLMGANLRFTLANKEKRALFMAAGAFGESETWTYAAVPSERKPEFHPEKVSSEAMKFNYYVKYFQHLGKNTQLELVAYYQARFTDVLLKPRVMPQASITIEISEELDLNSTFTGFYDFNPVVPVDNFFYSWFNSIVYHF